MDGFKMPGELEKLLSQQDMLRGGPQMGAGASMMPTPRSQAEIDALRGADQMQAGQMAKQMYRQANPQSTGLIGMGQDIYRSFSKDEKMQGFQDQAMQGLTQARTAEDLGARRTRQDEVNEILQGQNFEAGQARLTQAGQNTRAGANRSSQEGIAARTLEGQNTRAGNTITASMDRQNDQQAFSAATADVKPYHDGNGGILNVMRDPETFANFTVGADGTRTPVDTSRLTPYTASTQSGSRELAAEVRASEQRLTEGQKQIVDDMQASTLGRIMSFGDLEAATGRFDVRRMAANLFPVGERQENIQSMERQLNNARTLAMGPVLAMMGISPTDADMEVTLEGTPTAYDGPRVWIDYVRYEFAPAARSTGLLRLQEGLINDGRTAEDIELAYAELIGMADAAEERIFGGASDEGLGDFDPAAFGSKGDVSTLNDAQQDALLEYLMQNRAD